MHHAFGQSYEDEPATETMCRAADCCPFLPTKFYPLAVTKLEWQKPLQVVKYPDPRLRAKNAKIGVFDETLVTLAKEMMEIMYQ